MHITLETLRNEAHRRITALLRIYVDTRRAAMKALKENDIKTALYVINYINTNLKPDLEKARADAAYIDRQL